MAADTETTVPEFEDVTEFSRNMAEFLEISGQIAKLQIDRMADAKAPALTTPDPLSLMPTMANFASYFWTHPQEAMDLGMKYWADQVAVWTDASVKIMSGSDSVADHKLPNLPEGGRRFSHPDWSENAVLEYIKRSYLLTSQWANDLVTAAQPDLSPRDRHKIEYLMRGFLDASNPANFAGINPEVLQATRTENGANLVRGAQMMLEDMQRGKGELLIRQTDMDVFEVGRDMAVTPGKIVFQNHLFQLIQYEPTTEKVNEVPLLFIPPWINKYYVLDLNEKKSLMRWLVAQGHTVFIMSWVNPDESHANVVWEDYMIQGASTAIDKVIEETGSKQVNLSSYCIGGTLTGTLLAKMAKSGDKRVASTTFFTAQLDYEDAGELQAFVDEETIKLVDQASDAGYLPAQAMATAFNTLRSNDLVWSYMVANYMLGKEPFPFDLLYWNSDSTRMPAKVHHFYLEQFYVNNAFARGQLPVGDDYLAISDISGPVYHLAAVEDHIAPADSVYRGARMMIGADVRFVLAGSGHIAGVVNPEAAGKYQYWTREDLDAADLDEWRKTAKKTDGSWWPDWNVWLNQKSKKKVPARVPGKVLKPIEDAPGSYVKLRSDTR